METASLLCLNGECAWQQGLLTAGTPPRLLVYLPSVSSLPDQMLAAPLSRRRLAHVAAAMEVMALPVTWLLPLVGPSRAPVVLLLSEQGRPERMCLAVVLYVHILGCLVPVAASARWWKPPAVQAPGR